MRENAFTDKTQIPNDQMLKDSLGECYKYYKLIMEQTENFDNKWTYYKAYSLKVFRKNKALFYFCPYTESFSINMAIREKERDAFINDNDMYIYKEMLQNAKKYNEGYAVILYIDDEQSYNECRYFLDKLIPLR